MSGPRKVKRSNSAKKAAQPKNVVKPAYGELLYDQDGYRVGDDGYPLTKPRRRLHRLLDALLVFSYICIVVAVILVVWALFQGQSYTANDFIAYGGNEYKGQNVASLMRVEALVAFTIGFLGIIVSHRGFDWLYDGKDGSAVRWILLGLAALAVGWCAFLFVSVRIIDPVSCVYVLFGLFIFRAMRKVQIERPQLKPSLVCKPKKG